MVGVSVAVVVAVAVAVAVLQKLQRTYRLVEAAQHSGGRLPLVVGEGVAHGLVVHGVIKVDHLLGNLKSTSKAHDIT